MNRSTENLLEQIDTLARDAGADTEALSGKLVREMMHTAVKLVRDGADTGELKLISRSLKELRYALKIFRAHRDVPKVAIFGSARTPEDHLDYAAALEFGRRMAETGWMIITGAGPGIMQAGHGGAGRERSFGVSIRLPFETNANQFIEGDEKLIVFRYFFTRKLAFASQSHAMALFPGGFGTQDEGFEVLTLIQTGKAPIMPIVMIDPPGGTYWRAWHQFVTEQLLEKKLIDAEDLNLYMVTDNVEQAVEHIRRFYRRYHSQRFVRNELVLRMQSPLSARQLDELNDAFSDIVTEGQIESCRALPLEESHLNLPRLKFVFDRKSYGRLRALVDRINDLPNEA